jgi:hypothetical protein
VLHNSGTNFRARRTDLLNLNFRSFPVRALLTGVLGTSALAQTLIELKTQARGIDFQSAPYTRPMKAVSSLPGACAANDVVLLTTAPAGSNIYACLAQDTWVPQNGGGTHAVTIQNGGVTVGASNTENFVSGSGIITTVTDLGTKLNIQPGVDTSTILSRSALQSGETLRCNGTLISAGAYECSMTPALTAYTPGMVIHWLPATATTDGGTTLNIDLLGPVPVKGADGATSPVVADVLGGRLYSLWYDGSVFRLPPAGGGASGVSPIGLPNQVLATDAAGSSVNAAALRPLTLSDLPAAMRRRGFQVTFAGADVTSGVAIYVTMPYACTAVGYALSADPSGTATVRLLKVADGTALPAAGDSISTNGFTLSTGNRRHSTDLSDLTTTQWAAFDTTAVVLTAVSGNPAHVNFTLECNQ